LKELQLIFNSDEAFDNMIVIPNYLLKTEKYKAIITYNDTPYSSEVLEFNHLNAAVEALSS